MAAECGRFDVCERRVKYMDCILRLPHKHNDTNYTIVCYNKTDRLVRYFKRDERDKHTELHTFQFIRKMKSATQNAMLLLLIHNHIQNSSTQTQPLHGILNPLWALVRSVTYTHSTHSTLFIYIHVYNRSVMLCTQNHRSIRIANINDASVYLDLS